MKNGSKFEKIVWDKGLTLNIVAKDTDISYPTLVDINKGRIKKYHKTTIRTLCEYFSTDNEKFTPNDILGLIDPISSLNVNQLNQEQQNVQPDGIT